MYGSIFLYWTTFILSTSAKVFQSLNYAGFKSEWHRGTPHIFRLTTRSLSSSVYLYIVCGQTDIKNNHVIYSLYQDFTDLTCPSSVNLFESQRYGLVKSTQVPHIYCVSQPLPEYVYLCPVFHHFYVLNFLQSVSITDLCGMKYMQVPLTYYVLQPLASPVYLHEICVRINTQKLHKHMKCHLERRNLMITVSSECVVGDNEPDTK